MERRRGGHMRAQGISRDPGRSAHSPVVQGSGWRWRCCRRLTPMPWAGRVWALPLLTVLCPAARFYEPQGHRHPPLGERAWPIMQVVVRWWPRRALVCVADSRDAVLALLPQVSDLPRARLIPRRRLEAAREEPPPTREPGQLGRPRLQGARRPPLAAVWADEETMGSQLTMERW